MKHATIICLLLFLAACAQQPAVQGQSGKTWPVQCFEERPLTVIGDSMLPLYEPGDEVTLQEGWHDCNSLARGDLIVVKRPDSWAIKGIRGMPGDSFGLREENGTAFLVVEGEPVTNDAGERYTLNVKQRRIFQLYVDDYGDAIPPRTYLLLGENVAVSEDSRSFGLVRDDDFIGRVKP